MKPMLEFIPYKVYRANFRVRGGSFGFPGYDGNDEFIVKSFEASNYNDRTVRVLRRTYASQRHYRQLVDIRLLTPLDARAERVLEALNAIAAAAALAIEAG